MKSLLQIAGVAFVLLVHPAQAAITLTIQESGTNLVVSSSGTLNSAVCTSITPNFTSTFNGIDPSVANLAFGAVSSSQDQCSGTTITPSTGYGTGGSLSATTDTGVSYFFEPGAGFWGPAGWNSSTAMTSTMTFANASLTSAGLTPGTYVYTFANGATTDTLTINVAAPAPPVSTPTLSEWSVMLLVALLAMMGGLRFWRRAESDGPCT